MRTLIISFWKYLLSANMGSIPVLGTKNAAVNTESHPGGACSISGKTKSERLKKPACALHRQGAKENDSKQSQEMKAGEGAGVVPSWLHAEPQRTLLRAHRFLSPFLFRFPLAPASTRWVLPTLMISSPAACLSSWVTVPHALHMASRYQQ